MNTTLKIEVPAEIGCAFRSHSGIILVDALLNGKTRTFLLDSGAPTMLLNSKYIAKDKLSKGRFEFHGVGGSVPSLQTLVRTFNWHGLKYSNRNVHALDISHLEAQLESEVHGIIGYRELSNFSLRIDYKNKRLQLWREFDPQNFTITGHLPMVFHNHIPVITTMIDGQKFKLGLDTGAAVNMLDEKRIEQVPSFKAAKKTEDLHGAGKESIKVQHGKIPPQQGWRRRIQGYARCVVGCVND